MTVKRQPSRPLPKAGRLRAGLRSRAARLAARADQRPSLRLAQAFWREIQHDDIFGMAAEMAYRFLFAAFPLLLVFAAMLGFAGQAAGLDGLLEGVLNQARLLLPPDVSRLLDQQAAELLETRSSAALTFGLLGTLWGAAGGVGALIKGLDRAYDVEIPRPFWRRQLLALAVTLTLPPLGVALLALSVAGRLLAAWFDAGLGAGGPLVMLLNAVRLPAVFLTLTAGFSLLYHVLPNTRHRYRWSLPGSLWAAAGWLALTEAFGIYVANFGNYDAVYGSFGAIIAFLLWLYLVGVVVLLGAEINALLEPEQRRGWRHRDAPPS